MVVGTSSGERLRGGELRRKNQSRATVDANAKGKAPQMRTLTLRMMVWSTEAVVVGDELEIADSGDHRSQTWMKYDGLAKL
jgi:hypothetical protein